MQLWVEMVYSHMLNVGNRVISNKTSSKIIQIFDTINLTEIYHFKQWFSSTIIFEHLQSKCLNYVLNYITFFTFKKCDIPTNLNFNVLNSLKIGVKSLNCKSKQNPLKKTKNTNFFNFFARNVRACICPKPLPLNKLSKKKVR